MPRRLGRLGAERLPKITQGAAVSDSEAGSGCPSHREPQAPHQPLSGSRWHWGIFFFFLSPKSAGKRTACLQESIPPLSLPQQIKLSPPLPQPLPTPLPTLLPFETPAAESKGHHRSSRLGAGRVLAHWLREQPGSLGLWGPGWGWDSRFWVARLVGKQTIGCPRNDAFRKSQPRDLHWPITVCFYSQIYNGFKSIDMLTACKGNGSMHRAGFTSA